MNGPANYAEAERIADEVDRRLPAVERVTAPKVSDELADYTAGQLVTWHTNAGPTPMVYLGWSEPYWVELVSPTGQTGVVVHEREVSSR